MISENFTPLLSLAGGLLIGLAAIMLMLFNGKIAGVSGISKGIFFSENSDSQERNWRIFFIAWPDHWRSDNFPVSPATDC